MAYSTSTQHALVDQPLREFIRAYGNAGSQQDAWKLGMFLNATCITCTTKNVQACKNSIINDILPSATKTAATCKYISTLSRRMAPNTAQTDNDNAVEDDEEDEQSTRKESLPAYKRLHLLYVVHDVLETLLSMDRTKAVPNHLQSLDFNYLLEKVRFETMQLFRLAACKGNTAADNVSEELLHLVDYWSGGAFSKKEIDPMRDIVKAIPQRQWPEVLDEHAFEEWKKEREEEDAREERDKWIIPERHSVQHVLYAPSHRLPAANGLYMKSIHGYPLRRAYLPWGGYELKDGGLEADEDLKKDVTQLKEELLHCFDEFSDSEDVQDIDALGNKIWTDPDRPTRNHWGFSYDGIEKARENSRKLRESAKGYDSVMPQRQLLSENREWPVGQEPPPEMQMRQDMPMGQEMPVPVRQDPPMRQPVNVDAAVARAKALASGRGGFDNRGGFNDRGGDRGSMGGRGGWRRPPRGGPQGGGGFRGGRGRGYY